MNGLEITVDISDIIDEYCELQKQRYIDMLGATKGQEFSVMVATLGGIVMIVYGLLRLVE